MPRKSIYWAQAASVALLQQQSAVLQQEEITFELERPLVEAQIELAELQEEQRQERANELGRRLADDRVLKVREQVAEFENEISQTPLAEHELTIETRAIAAKWQDLIFGQGEG